MLYEREQTIAFERECEVREQRALDGRGQHVGLFDTLMKGDERASTHERDAEYQSRRGCRELTLDHRDQGSPRGGAFLRFLQTRRGGGCVSTRAERLRQTFQQSRVASDE